MPRFAELFGALGIRATWFVIGRDVLADPEGRALLVSLAGAGHELANHTHSHFYDFVRRPADVVVSEIERAHQAIGDCAGRAPVGFRAPGYTTTAAVLARLCERGYRYDSSAFPSFPYYVAKAAVMAAMRLGGRASGSVLGSPRALAAPAGPYRPAADDPYARGDMPIWELPVAITPILRLPVIGTSVVTAPAWARRRLVSAVARAPFVNLELHGIDLADASGDGFPVELVARQPDLRRSLAQKRVALEATLLQLRAAGFAFQPLGEVAAALERAAPAGATFPGGVAAGAQLS